MKDIYLLALVKMKAILVLLNKKAPQITAGLLDQSELFPIDGFIKTSILGLCQPEVGWISTNFIQKYG